MRYFLCFLLMLTVSCVSNFSIVNKPINFDDERIELTLDYMRERYGLQMTEPVIEPQMIVLHWTAIPTFKKSFEAFKNNTLPNWRPDIASVSGLNVSAHFLVDRDGTIYRLMPENIMGRHTIGLNHCAIGIENVGGTSETPLTKKQVSANAFLVKYLSEKYPIEYVIGHHQYTDFENHELWLEKDDQYRTQKTDPGDNFMQRVLQKVNLPHLKNKR